VYLTAPDEKLPPELTLPLPEQCVQLIPSRAQFAALEKVAGKAIIVRGDLHFVQRSEDTALVSVRIDGRYAHPECQYQSGRLPFIVIKSWHLASVG